MLLLYEAINDLFLMKCLLGCCCCCIFLIVSTGTTYVAMVGVFCAYAQNSIPIPRPLPIQCNPSWETSKVIQGNMILNVGLALNMPIYSRVFYERWSQERKGSLKEFQCTRISCFILICFSHLQTWSIYRAQRWITISSNVMPNILHGVPIQMNTVNMSISI